MGRYKKTIVVKESLNKKKSFRNTAKPILLALAMSVSSFAGVLAIAVDPNLPQNMVEFPDRIGAFLDGKKYVSKAEQDARNRKLAKLQFKTMLTVSLQGLGKEFPYAQEFEQMSDDYADACFDGFHAGELDVFGFPNIKNFATISKDLSTNIEELAGMASGCSYLMGIHFGIAGIFKIKDHVENPTQTPLQHGASRLAAGGSLFALPIVSESMLN